MDEKLVKEQFKKPSGTDAPKTQLTWTDADIRAELAAIERANARKGPLTAAQQAHTDEINKWIRVIKQTNKRGNYTSYGRCRCC